MKRLLTFLLCTSILLLPAQHIAAPSTTVNTAAGAPRREIRLWCGLIDPELSRSLARIPTEGQTPLFWEWDWSLQGFLSSLLFNIRLTEGTSDAPIV